MSSETQMLWDICDRYSSTSQICSNRYILVLRHLCRHSICVVRAKKKNETPVQPLHLRAAVALLLFRLCHQLEEKLEDGMRAEVSQELRNHVFALDDLVV